MEASAHANDEFLFIDDSEEDEILDDANGKSWQVLIVDDDPEIHSVTQLALSDLIVLGRRLEYLHAYSGQDAINLIENNADIVLVLLDVVMETDDAGLNVVKHIRDELQRADIRIVLRTGQPGYAPEESVIKDYDINDYKTKTELTRRKLVTTVYAAIRAYQQISTVNANKIGLEKIINSASELLELHTIQDFAHGVLHQIKRQLNIEFEGVFCSRGQGIIEDVDDLNLYILGQLGLSNDLVNQKIEQYSNQHAHMQLVHCFKSKEHLYYSEQDTHSLTLYLASGGFRAVIHLALPQELTDTQQQLLKVFVTNVSIGFENAHLFQKLSHAAYKDWLTALPNRLEFVKFLDSFAQSEQNEGVEEEVAALIDINHFSDINDGLGQDVGNQLLKAIAHRMATVNADCKVARIGADVFGLIGPVSCLTFDKLNQFFQEPFIAGEHTIPVNACFGFCSKEHANNSTGIRILNKINIALNLAKKGSGENYAFYTTDMEDKTQWRLNMIRQLRSDFAQNRLELWYQPQLSLTSKKVIGAEALLRWRTLEGKFISPAVFIPLAEYSGLIIDIGEWVINHACKQVKVLEKFGYDDICISVNVSIPQFRRGDFVETVIKAINKHNVEPKKLELEITENILMDDPELVIDSLVKLKAQGIGIALDDFGTGFSSLNYLQKLPLDRLKVDRAFVTDIHKEGQSIIAETIINLGQKMGLKVIAEGIEEIEEQNRLIELNCDEVQGFYYAKPMPASEFLDFLQNHK